MVYKIGYYPGCSLQGMQKPFDTSVKKVCKKVGIQLMEPADWNCCGATSGHSVDHDLTLTLGARNLNLIAAEGVTEATAPCSACYSNLKAASLHLQDPAKKAVAEKNLGEESKNLNVVTIVELLSRPEIMANLKRNMTRKFRDLKVACYYGCLMVRPRTDTGAEDSENPMGMDNLLRAVGIETPDWSSKTECCGASSLLCNPEISKIRIRDVLNSAQASGADAIAVACPLCHMNLEMTLEDQGRKIPVVYFTQLLGLALGCNVKDVELNKMLVQYDWDSKLI